MSNVEITAKTKLAQLMQAVQPVINQKISEMQPSEVDFILKNFRKFLKIDLERDFEQAKAKGPSPSGIEDILGDFQVDKI
jgi:hypothetical protein